MNAYGVEFGDRQAFSKLLRACGEVEGLERVRFTSPHPAEFTDDVIHAMAETPNVMPQLHMPLQSGSDRVLKAMRRSYRQSKFLGIIDRVREAMPDAAISTDIIVGFPGETEEDFLDTLDVVRRARFSGAYTFQYSKRPGTPAADLPDQLPKAVVQERYERLVDPGQRHRLGGEHRSWSGRPSSCWSPRARAARTPPPTGAPAARATTGWCTSRSTRRRTAPRPGDVVEVDITYAAPHHLMSDAPLRSLRRTRSGDAWEARTRGPKPTGTLLGLPQVGRPRPAAAGDLGLLGHRLTPPDHAGPRHRSAPGVSRAGADLS